MRQQKLAHRLVVTCVAFVAAAGCSVAAEGDDTDPAVTEGPQDGRAVVQPRSDNAIGEESRGLLQRCTATDNLCPSEYSCRIPSGSRTGRCTKASCSYNGQVYSAGGSFLSTDGCNLCTCMSSGQVACTLKLCGVTCNYHGTLYAVGASWAPHDVCSCWCDTDGRYACNQARCF